MRAIVLTIFILMTLASCSPRNWSGHPLSIYVKASKEIESGNPDNSLVTARENNIAASMGSSENTPTSAVKDDVSAEKKTAQPPHAAEKKPGIGQKIKAIRQAKSIKENNPTAMDAFVMSLLGFVLPPLISAFVLGPPGLLIVINVIGFVFLMLGFGKGIKALKELKQYEGQKGKGFAITALILGILGVAAIIGTLIVLGVF